MKTSPAQVNMIKQQIRTWGVTDPEVIDLLTLTPRVDFVPEAYQDLAYADMNIPLPNGYHMLTPKAEAKMIDALQLQADETVLEIGTGSGYLTALMAKQAKHVYSVDCDKQQSEQAASNLAKHNLKNVDFESGDAAKGWPAHEPYQVIVIGASLPILPEVFKTSLKIGGRLLAILGDGPAMEVTLVERTSNNDWNITSLFETSVPPLKDAEQPERFTF